MNSKAVKILLEVLGAVVVSVALSYIPQESLPFFVSSLDYSMYSYIQQEQASSLFLYMIPSWPMVL